MIKNNGQASIQFLQWGTSLTECLIVLPIVLIIGCFSLEITRWFMIKHSLDYATFEAARRGSVTHANPHVMYATLLQAFIPLLGSGKHLAENQLGQYSLRSHLFSQEGDNQYPLVLDIINPSKTSYQDFLDGDLTRTVGGGSRTIRNNFQSLKNDSVHHGIKSASGQNIFDANLLTIQVSYFYQPVVPGMSKLLKNLSLETLQMSIGLSSPTLRQAFKERGALLVVSHITIPMQSHPIESSYSVSSLIMPEKISDSSVLLNKKDAGIAQLNIPIVNAEDAHPLESDASDACSEQSCQAPEVQTPSCGKI